MKRFLGALFAQPWLSTIARLWSTNSLVVLAYHRVRRRGETSPFADSVFSVEVDEFARQMAWLAKNTRPMSETDVLACIMQRKPFPKRATLVTFDDGYSDQFIVCAPILKRYEVPAICFIPTSPISERTTYWWDEIAWIVKRTEADLVTLGQRRFDLSAKGRLHAIDLLIEHFKETGALERMALMEDLRRRLAVEDVPHEVADMALMTWEQVKVLGDYGVSVGCHTVDHSMLSQLDGSAQERDLRSSKAELESRTGRPVLSVAYPFGARGHFNAETKGIARKVGFRLGFSLVSGINRTDRLDRFSVSRTIPPSEMASFVRCFIMPRFILC
jgi:peptidoglycan/xylan/chitin deacetylase (PgdA/CDA1 family)